MILVKTHTESNQFFIIFSGFFYHFTKLKKKSKARIKRTVSSGTWKGRSVKEKANSIGNIKWLRKDFVFQIGKKKGSDSSDSNGHWITIGFSLKNAGWVVFVLMGLSVLGYCPNCSDFFIFPFRIIALYCVKFGETTKRKWIFIWWRMW